MKTALEGETGVFASHARRVPRRQARDAELAEMLYSIPMRQPVRRLAVKRGLGYVAVTVAMVLATNSIAGARDAAHQPPVPLPQPRPATHDTQAPSPTASQDQDQRQPSQTDDAARDGEACLARLRASNVRFDIPTMPIAAKAACMIEAPVRLRSVAARAPAGAEIRLPEEPVLSCRFAERLIAWLGDLAAPVIAGRLSTSLKAARTGPGYECRNRNGAADGKLSAHAVGQAIDITAFDLSNGKSIPIKPDGDETMRSVVDTVRTAACGWFTTVLGPGADAAHTDHLHVDMIRHGNSDRYRICQ